MRSRRSTLGLLALAGLVAFIAVQSEAASPPTQGVTVPAAGGQTQTYTWTGTAPANSIHPTSNCNDPGAPGTDVARFDITVPSQGHDAATATFTFQINWDDG